MKINEECIRDILQFFVENLTIEIKEGKGRFASITMLDAMNVFEETYSKEDIWYSVYNLAANGLIESDDVRKNSKDGFAFVEIYNVTNRGHMFYESIQPQPIWEKTKGIVSKVGVHTIGFIESVAHDVAVESAKQMISISSGHQVV